MKKMMTLVMMMTIAISAAAMPYNTARNEALYLSDKMAYELGLTASQYEAVYEINLDYLLNVDTRADVFGFWWEIRAYSGDSRSPIPMISVHSVGGLLYRRQS